ncbi:tRNA (adenosine(37)-N6)-threonylcarbamoyltransferase complex dimerization subunit type 1 TsaB [Candidatus Babeliales bacterium]|nr:tRNA (adenosine(37)-N6)-threonylcarbamoyltransferase complex dimerization subunit type 1 TsaB [Candidatus Babeliales bacterium]
MKSDHYILSLQGSYKTSQVSLYKSTQCVQKSEIHSIKASAALVPLIETLLWKEKISLSNLDYIALDQGPGAFTSLRVTIVTANAISFASKIQLIGINGLKALALDMFLKRSALIKNNNIKIVCPLLNAYNNEVYSYAIRADSFRSIISKPQCLNVETFLDTLKQKQPNKQILFTGNGSKMHRELIEKQLGQNAIFESTTIDQCSADSVAKLAFEHIAAEKKTAKKVLPIYMKKGMHTPKPKKAH